MADGQDASLHLKRWANQETIHGVKHGKTGWLTLLTYLVLLRFSGADSITMPCLVLMWHFIADTLPVMYPL